MTAPTESEHPVIARTVIDDGPTVETLMSVGWPPEYCTTVKGPFDATGHGPVKWTDWTQDRKVAAKDHGLAVAEAIGEKA